MLIEPNMEAEQVEDEEEHYSGIDKYESNDFEVGRYKWNLCVHPKGNKKVNENDHISLYLVLSKSNAFALDREVNVYLKLFVYNQIQDKYLTVQDANWRIRRFRGSKTEHGFDQLVPLDVFNDASNGYLIDDCCIFGVEVFVLEPTNKGECVSIVKDLSNNNTFTWNVKNFVELKQENCTHPKEFVIGGYKWILVLWPNGYADEKGKSLTLNLRLEDQKAINRKDTLYIEYALRIKDQVRKERVHELSGRKKFDASTDGYTGFWKFIPLSKLKDASEGYLLNGCIILEVQISLMTLVKEFS